MRRKDRDQAGTARREPGGRAEEDHILTGKGIPQVTRKAGQLGPGNVVLLDGLYARDPGDLIPRGREFTVREAEAGDPVWVDGRAEDGHDACLRVREGREVAVRVSAVLEHGGQLFAACTRPELSFGMQFAAPRHAAWTVVRDAGYPVMAGYVNPDIDGDYEAHRINGVSLGFHEDLPHAMAVIAADVQAKDQEKAARSGWQGGKVNGA